MSATQTHQRSASVTRPAKNRSAMSNAPTVPGLDETDSWSKIVGHGHGHQGRTLGNLGQVISGRPRPPARPADSGSGSGRASALIGPPPRSPGHHGLSGPSILVGQPVASQTEIDPGGGDGPVTGQHLNGLDGHARLLQPGEAGVAELVAGPMHQSGPGPGGAEHLVQTFGGESLPVSWTFEDNEQAVGGGVRWSFPVEVVGHRGEEGRRDGDQSLVAAFAVSDEQLLLADPEILQPQTQHLASAQAPEQHGQGHGPVGRYGNAASNNSTSSASRIRGNRRTPLTRGTPRWSRWRLRRLGMPRGTGLAVTPASPRMTR